MKPNLGFTLIELLVVISIIALLSSIVLTSLNSARSNARDASRIAQIKELQIALELYYHQYGRYPVTGSCLGSNSPNVHWCNSAQKNSNGRWIVDQVNGQDLSAYLPNDPIDPAQTSTPKWTPNDGGTFFYYSLSYGGAGQWYMIVYGLENTDNPIQQNDGVIACDNSYFHYGTNSDGLMTVGGNCVK